MVPLENSTNGQVALSYDLIRNWFFHNTLSSSTRTAQGLKININNNENSTEDEISSSLQLPNFEVFDEQYVSIHHNLLTQTADISKVEKIYSHPQVWTQCMRFFTELMDQGVKINKIDTNSTSRAAQLVLQDIKNGITNTASISSSTASQIYSLNALRQNIEDDKNNTTRFLVFGKRKHKPEDLLTDANGGTAAVGAGTADDAIGISNTFNTTHTTSTNTTADEVLGNITNQNPIPVAVDNTKNSSENDLHTSTRATTTTDHVTFIAIRIQSENTGFLCDALNFFKKHNINLANINTRPSQIVKWQYIFFIELYGDLYNDENVKSCIKELQQNVIELKIIGCFKRNPEYFNNKIEPYN